VVLRQRGLGEGERGGGGGGGGGRLGKRRRRAGGRSGGAEEETEELVIMSIFSFYFVPDRNCHKADLKTHIIQVQ